MEKEIEGRMETALQMLGTLLDASEDAVQKVDLRLVGRLVDLGGERVLVSVGRGGWSLAAIRYGCGCGCRGHPPSVEAAIDGAARIEDDDAVWNESIESIDSVGPLGIAIFFSSLAALVGRTVMMEESEGGAWLGALDQSW